MKKNKGGRPTLAEGGSKVVSISLSVNEYRDMHKIAKAMGTTMSEFTRMIFAFWKKNVRGK